MRPGLTRTTELQIEETGLVTDFPVPGAVLFDLPQQAFTGFRIFQESRGNIFLRGPVADIGDVDRFGRAAAVKWLIQAQT